MTRLFPAEKMSFYTKEYEAQRNRCHLAYNVQTDGEKKMADTNFLEMFIVHISLCLIRPGNIPDGLC